jgi:hypothetical protein
MADGNRESNVMTLKEASTFIRCSKAHFCNIANGKVPGLPPLKRIGSERESDKVPIYAAFRKTTNSVLVAAILCTFKSR